MAFSMCIGDCLTKTKTSSLLFVCISMALCFQRKNQKKNARNFHLCLFSHFEPLPLSCKVIHRRTKKKKLRPHLNKNCQTAETMTSANIYRQTHTKKRVCLSNEFVGRFFMCTLFLAFAYQFLGKKKCFVLVMHSDFFCMCVCVLLGAFNDGRIYNIRTEIVK